MNILTLLPDCTIYILSRVDVRSLWQLVTVCRHFTFIINRIVLNAVRNDIIEYLFRIPTLSSKTLEKYLSYTLTNDHVANLMLAAFTSNNHATVLKIIESQTCGGFYPLSQDTILNSNLDFVISPLFYDNMFLSTIPFKLVPASTVSINYRKYFETWLITILNANRIDILDQMYPFERTTKYKIFDYVPTINSFSAANQVTIDNHIKKMLYEGNVGIIQYYRKYVFTKCSNIWKNIMKSIIYLLYGGHLDFFLECFINQQKIIVHYHKFIVCCLLRCNHIDQYEAYALKNARKCYLSSN